MALNKQMEMFEDGGLKDEGGMIDEVSGNDVPLGSTREEVRDDIPAQLSEGEFVFPADVVRFIGLEKLMQLRQEAKQGLKQMEAMGQMGNSDEATMPDDLPFDETDLDMEDELEYNRGGVVEAANGTFVQNTMPITYNPLNTTQTSTTTGNPTQMQPTAVTSNPYTGNPQTAYKTGIKPYAPVDYTTALGTSAVGAPQTESVRYFNAATGQSRTIPHIINADGSRGATLFPVPDGFVIQEEAPKEEAKKTTKVQSTQVQQQQDDGGDSEPMDTSTKDPSGISYNRSTLQSEELKSLFDKVGVFSGLSILNPSLNIARSAMGKGNVASASNAALGGSIDSYRGGDVNYYGTNQRNTGLQSGIYNDNRSLNDLTGVEQKTLGTIGNTIFSSVIEPMVYDVDKDGNKTARSNSDIRNSVVEKAKELGLRTTIPGTNIAARTETIMRAVAKKEAEKLLKQKEEKEQRAQVAREKERAALAEYEQSIKDKAITAAEDRRITQIQQESQDSDGGYDTGGGYSVSDSDFSGFYNQGGLAGKKKTPKPKKMKQGGLASR